MHLILPFAAALSLQRPAALPGFLWPGLQASLRGMHEVARDEGNELSLSTPHERALARALGWSVDVSHDGLLPWAARSAAQDGIGVASAAWGLISPAHWHLGTEQLSLGDPAALMLDEAGSHALLLAVSDTFTSLGFALHYGAPTRWYLSHPSLAEMPCASLDRVIGRNVDRWLTSNVNLRLLRRLQSEVQMLLHGHPINALRQSRGLMPVNSFWLSGCGVFQSVAGPEPTVDDRLRGAALADDGAAWAQAWAVIDSELLARVKSAPWQRITLCGESSSVTYEMTQTTIWQQLQARWRPVEVATLLEHL